jgi:uncharacterized protein (TIGR02757 family)
MKELMIKEFLEEKCQQYNTVKFIESDPIVVPHSFSLHEDIEIAGFLTATIAWGVRKTIIKNAFQLMKFMDNSPYDFVMNSGRSDLQKFEHFRHRTFNGVDAVCFIKALKNICIKHNGLKNAFEFAYSQTLSIKGTLSAFRKMFTEKDFEARTGKHIANVETNASAKRLNMFLRWMVRNDNKGVDFGLWKNIPPSALHMPLDIHSGNVARKLLLLNRKQNDWKAVEELTSKLREFDPADPVKYDFALFGLGIFEGF